MIEFIMGFLSAFIAVVVLLIYAGGQIKPVLGKRLEALEAERREQHARAIKNMVGKIDGRKVSTIDTVRIQSTPAHISSHGAPCRMTMFGTAITIATAHQCQAIQAGNSDESRSPVSKKQDRVLCTLNSKNLHASLDPSDRWSIILEPRVAGEYVAEVDDERTVDGKNEVVRCKWRSLKIMFVHGGAREAERWMTVMNPSAATERWLRFVKSIPEKHEGCFNMLVARILFENSSTSTLDNIIAGKVRRKLADIKLPRPLFGELKLVYVHFGDEAPFFTNTEFAGFAPSGEFSFNFDVVYRGGFQLSLAASVEFAGFTVPTVIVDVLIREVKGRAQVSIGGPPSDKMWIGFHEPPQLAIELRQDIQVPDKLQFLSQGLKALDLSSVVSDVVKTRLFEDMILPQMDDIHLPNLGPTPPGTPRDEQQRPDHAPPVLTGWEMDAERPMWDKDHEAHVAATIAVQATPGTDSKTVQAELSKLLHSGEATSTNDPKERSATPLSASKSKSKTTSPAATPVKDRQDESEESAHGVRKVAHDVKQKLKELLHKHRTTDDRKSRTPSPQPETVDAAEPAIVSGAKAASAGNTTTHDVKHKLKEFLHKHRPSGDDRKSRTPSPQPENVDAEPAIVSGGKAVARVPHPAPTGNVAGGTELTQLTPQSDALGELQQHRGDNTSSGDRSGGRSPTHEWVKDMAGAHPPANTTETAAPVVVAPSKDSAKSGTTSTRLTVPASTESGQKSSPCNDSRSTAPFVNSAVPAPTTTDDATTNSLLQARSPGRGNNDASQSTDSAISRESSMIPEHQNQKRPSNAGQDLKEDPSTSSPDIVSTPTSGRLKTDNAPQPRLQTVQGTTPAAASTSTTTPAAPPPSMADSSASGLANGTSQSGEYLRPRYMSQSQPQW